MFSFYFWETLFQLVFYFIFFIFEILLSMNSQVLYILLFLWKAIINLFSVW